MKLKILSLLKQLKQLNNYIANYHSKTCQIDTSFFICIVKITKKKSTSASEYSEIKAYIVYGTIRTTTKLIISHFRSIVYTWSSFENK